VGIEFPVREAVIVRSAGMVAVGQERPVDRCPTESIGWYGCTIPWSMTRIYFLRCAMLDETMAIFIIMISVLYIFMHFKVRVYLQ
jgi:hypothetical protein